MTSQSNQPTGLHLSVHSSGDYMTTDVFESGLSLLQYLLVY